MSTVDAIREKAANQDRARMEAARRRAAHEAGFDDEADYELWEALESLRSATLRRREAERARPQTDEGLRVTTGRIVLNK